MGTLSPENQSREKLRALHSKSSYSYQDVSFICVFPIIQQKKIRNTSNIIHTSIPTISVSDGKSLQKTSKEPLRKAFLAPHLTKFRRRQSSPKGAKCFQTGNHKKIWTPCQQWFGKTITPSKPRTISNILARVYYMHYGQHSQHFTWTIISF